MAETPNDKFIHLTVRRMLTGRLALMVGDQEVAGVSAISLASNEKDSHSQIFIQPASLYFDNEKQTNAH